VFSFELYSQDQVVLDSLRIQLNSVEEDSAKIKALWNLAEYYGDLDFDVSLDYSNKALNIALKNRNLHLIAESYSKIGYFLILKGDYDKAHTNFLKCLEIFETISDEVKILVTYNHLGIINDRVENYGKALDYYFKALEIYNNGITRNSEKIKSFKKIYSIYNNIGNIYIIKNEYETALNYYRKGLKLALENTDDRNVGLIYNNLGKTFTYLKKYEEAQKYFNKSLEARKRANDLSGMATTYYMMGNYYTLIGDYNKALEVLKKSQKLGEEVGSLETQQVAANFLCKIYEKTSQFKQAYQTYQLYKVISDSLLNERTIRELTRAQMQFEFEKIEKIQIAEHKREFMMHALIISVLTLGVIIIALLYWGVKNRERKNVLVRKNLEQDLDLKNRELTTNVLYLIKKNELINGISDRLLKLKPRLKEENKEPVQKIVFDLHCGVDQEIWKDFEIRFQQIHSGFYNNLQERFPDLSPGERKLAAFLRLNMTTKEIASITGQTTKSLEVARYRLRKKLDISNKEINLINFLCEM